MAEMKSDDQIECDLPHRFGQQPAAELIALVKRENRVDKGGSGGCKARLGENRFGGVNRAEVGKGKAQT